MLQSINDQNLEDILKKNNKVIIKFYADWCGICKAFGPEFEKIAESEASAEISFFEINAPENPKARLMAGVYSLPFFASFENGELVSKVASSDRKAIDKLILELQDSSSVVK